MRDITISKKGLSCGIWALSWGEKKKKNFWVGVGMAVGGGGERGREGKGVFLEKKKKEKRIKNFLFDLYRAERSGFLIRRGTSPFRSRPPGSFPHPPPPLPPPPPTALPLPPPPSVRRARAGRNNTACKRDRRWRYARWHIF